MHLVPFGKVFFNVFVHCIRLLRVRANPLNKPFGLCNPRFFQTSRSELFNAPSKRIELDHK